MWKLTIPGHMENERWIPERDTELGKLIQFVRTIIAPLIFCYTKVVKMNTVVAKSIGLAFTTLVILVYIGVLVSRGGSDLAVRQSIYAVMVYFTIVMGLVLIYRSSTKAEAFTVAVSGSAFMGYFYYSIVPGWQSHELEGGGWEWQYVSETGTTRLFYIGFIIFLIYLSLCYYALECERPRGDRAQQRAESYLKEINEPFHKPPRSDQILEQHPQTLRKKHSRSMTRNNRRAIQIYGKPFGQLTSDQKEKLKK